MTESDAIKLAGGIKELRVLEEDQNKIRFSAKLALNILNVGSKPAILLKQDFDIGAEMMALTDDDANTNRYIYRSSHWPSVSQDAGWASLREDLNTAAPQQDQLSTLSPGESLSFEATTALYIEKARYPDWDEIRESPHLSLKVQVELWPTNLEPDRNPKDLRFGEKLRQRWQPFGDLQLGKLTSEPMYLHLRDQEEPCNSLPASSDQKTSWGHEEVIMKFDQPLSSLRGTVVVAATSQPLEGVLVEVFDKPESLLKGWREREAAKEFQNRLAARVTGPDGTFCFPEIPPGTYELRSSKPSEWDPTSAYVIVDPARQRTVFTVPLHPSQ